MYRLARSYAGYPARSHVCVILKKNYSAHNNYLDICLNIELLTADEPCF